MKPRTILASNYLSVCKEQITSFLFLPAIANASYISMIDGFKCAEKNLSKNDATNLSSTGLLKTRCLSSFAARLSNHEDNKSSNTSQPSETTISKLGNDHDSSIDKELKETLRRTLWHFRAPIRFAFAYGSGVFPQSRQTYSIVRPTSIHPNPPPAVLKAQGCTPKMIDFIFGVSHTQHWHSLNLAQHRDHYSALGSLGSGAVSAVQEKWGAGVYFNPYVLINGMIIKYGVVNLDNLCTDLSQWTTLYLAGRLQKPVKILRDDPRVRLANHINLTSALRTALLLLPSEFTENDLYGTIASISYTGDPRMTLPLENRSKVANIVGNNLPNFRKLYSHLIENLPNVNFKEYNSSDPTANFRLVQDMDPIKRGNMVRRLPEAFRSKLYFQYQKKYRIPQLVFNEMLKASTDEDPTRIKRREGGGFERRIAMEIPEDLRSEVRGVIKNTVRWPSTSQSLKGPVTAGLTKTCRYLREKISSRNQGSQKAG
ncbi:Bgt-358 [Blumeria graminis f. sp. tritici]|uniref:Phosphatidate cytidylyltransferase, mitochondrial n=2 Tax=Blumeria graminis f. sp. tritici TaxID=62690 RepID=A0A381L769_BLUGR|nr:Mitochondrial protein [Blumeria graminis f. sp. tritici 96224]VDB83687.1 Bgt-358 [Blumeria graminis f. sp. tritici]